MRRSLKLLSSYLLLYCLFACVESPEFALEEVGLNEIDIQSTTNMEGIIKAYENSEQDIYTFKSEDTIIFSAYVISSDEAGNFFKTLIVQDKPENPLHGLEVRIDLKSYYSKYNFGRKLLINVSGLSIQKVNEKYILGYLLKGEIDEIPSPLLDSFIYKSEKTETIVPFSVELKDYSKGMINTFIELRDVQFAHNELNKTFSSEVYDTYNGERIIEQCEALERTTLFTSVYAKFKTRLLPEDSFHIRAVLTRDYYSGDIHLMLNHLLDIEESVQPRCDPSFFNCDGEQEIKEGKVVYYENFDALKSTADLVKLGWKNLNVNFGNSKFRKRSSNENTYVQVTAYNSDEYVMDAWLISPELSVPLEKNVSLSFDSRATFEEGTVLTLWFSTDYQGDFINSNWHQLQTRVSVGSRDDGNKTFQNSGKIPIGCMQEKFHLAFRYLGADPGISTTYDIDNILILGEY
ncbi:DUF5689 domain-containing protein [Lutimonas sp.]|uniref:DUF5689 domain-containing protein n=1 Tax=Lutimonas sp. TaxID=1872403 RepID=UPI003D9BC85E